jgi:hypothetical protein
MLVTSAYSKERGVSVMKIIRIAMLFGICLTLSSRATAQLEQLPTLSVEYGELSELRTDQNRVFVHTENLESRGRILKELKKCPRLQIVGRMEDADFLLVYGSSLVRTSPDLLDNSFAEPGGFAAVYGDLIALTLVGDRRSLEVPGGTHTRILWYLRKRQSFIRTGQFFPSSPFGGSSSKATLISSLVGGLLSNIPKLAWLPMSRSPEAGATRAFIKDLNKAYEVQMRLNPAGLLPAPLANSFKINRDETGRLRDTERDRLSSLFEAPDHQVVFGTLNAAGTKELSLTLSGARYKHRRHARSRRRGRAATRTKPCARRLTLARSRRRNCKLAHVD